MTQDQRTADDLVSFAGTHRALQAKVDIVSGFCLIVGLEVAVEKKLRCFHMSWGNGERDAPCHILIHLQGGLRIQSPAAGWVDEVFGSAT